MTGNNHADLLVTLLNNEREALLRADFQELDTIAAQKETCLLALQRSALGPETLEKLKKLGVRNQSLLNAAKQGLDIAKQALAALSSAQIATTYGPDGQRRMLRDASENLSQKI